MKLYFKSHLSLHKENNWIMLKTIKIISFPYFEYFIVVLILVIIQVYSIIFFILIEDSSTYFIWSLPT